VRVWQKIQRQYLRWLLLPQAGPSWSQTPAKDWSCSQHCYNPHPPPNIVLAASTATATGDLHPPNIDLAANPASESHFAFEQVEEEVVQNCDHQYNLKGVARKFSSLFCFFNHIFSADPGCLSLIRLFSIPDPESELYPSRIRCLFDPWIRNPE